MTLGLLLDPPTQNEIGRAFLRALSEGVEMEARHRGYDFLVLGPTAENEVFERGLAYGQEGRADALVAPGAKPALAGFDTSRFSVPLVLLTDDRHGTGLPWVGLDEGPGIREAVRHLAELGHRRLLWLSLEGKQGDVAPKRRDALTEAARAEGVSLTGRLLPAPEGAEADTFAGYIGHCRRAFLDALPGLAGSFTGIFCYNEAVGFGITAALIESGLRVPRDISVVGFDDICAHFSTPAMTVVSHMLPEIGARGAALALEMAGSGRPPAEFRGRRELVPARLVVRASTAAPPAG
jgi:LacI family transcriptional regulator